MGAIPIFRPIGSECGTKPEGIGAGGQYQRQHATTTKKAFEDKMPNRLQWWRDRLRHKYFVVGAIGVALLLAGWSIMVLARGRDVLLSRIRHYSTSVSVLSSAQGSIRSGAAVAALSRQS